MAQNRGARVRQEYRNCTSKNENVSTHFCLTLLETTKRDSNYLWSLVGKKKMQLLETSSKNGAVISKEDVQQSDLLHDIVKQILKREARAGRGLKS